MAERIPCRLFKQLMEAKVSDEEVAELYDDLKYIFDDTTFDDAVHAAIARGAYYVEEPEQRPN
jgi:hypothetical protein